jgi:hypothetical protein
MDKTSSPNSGERTGPVGIDDATDAVLGEVIEGTYFWYICVPIGPMAALFGPLSPFARSRRPVGAKRGSLGRRRPRR